MIQAKFLDYFRSLKAGLRHCSKLLSSILVVIYVSNANAALKIPSTTGETFISADYVEYVEAKNYVHARGNIKITVDNYQITSNDVVYDLDKDLLWAKGEVKITQGKDKVLFGDSIIFRDKLKSGIISDFVLKFKNNNSIVASKLAERINSEQIYLYKTRFTPCDVTCNKKPIWQLAAKETYIKFDENKLIYKNLFFEVYGVPVFFTPYFSHPTPDAPAQSGILVPSIKNNGLSVPVYYRAKPNMDFTLTPRLATKNTIFEFNGRHKISSGYYEVDSSYGEVAYKNKKVHSAYVSALGNFQSNKYNYGFNINRTTDKAYLKNYHERYDSHLASKVYFSNINYDNYLLIEGMQFQGLRTEDSNNTDPLVLPKIRTRNIMDISEDGSCYAMIQSDTLAYREPRGTQIGRGSLNLDLIKNMRLISGHLFGVTGRIRDDLYFIRDKYETKRYKNIKNRNIPEVQASWRYPLINQTSATNITIEPLASVTVGKKFRSNYNKYGFIDPSKYEIGDDNLLESNRYSGIDYHEFGNRFSYGVNTALLSGSSYYDLFLGQFLHKHNSFANDNVGNVGKFSAHLNETLEIFYRFRRDKHYKSIRDEIGGDVQYDRFKLNSTFIKLENIKKYYASEDFTPVSNHARQFYYNMQYELNSNWSVGHEMRFDLATRKIQPLYKSIKVTYFKDCVSIALKLYDDYTFDRARGIKKTHSKSVTLGLKVLNM